MENFGIGILTQNTFDGTHVDISSGFEWEIFSVDYSFGADNQLSQKAKLSGVHPCTEKEFTKRFPDMDKRW